MRGKITCTSGYIESTSGCHQEVLIDQFTAGFGTAARCLGALAAVIIHILLAVLCAQIAEGGTGLAQIKAHRRIAGEKPGAEGAHIGAVTAEPGAVVQRVAELSFAVVDAARFAGACTIKTRLEGRLDQLVVRPIARHDPELR
jgi:hypothetical protein